MIQREKRAVVRGGFTLMEMLVVVAIIVVLAGAAVPIYMRYLDQAKQDTAKMSVKTIEQQVEAYKLKNSDYPADLGVLTQLQQDGSPAYLEISSLRDPWGREFIYEPENHNPLTGRPHIYSQGANPGNPNGIIANW